MGEIIKLQELPTSLVPLVQSTNHGSLFALPLDSLNPLIDHLRLGKWISYSFPHLMAINMFLVMVCMFSRWTEAFSCRELNASSAARALLEKFILTWGAPLQLFSVQRTHFISQVLRHACTAWLFLQYFHCTYHLQSSGLLDHINDIIKTWLAMFLETPPITLAKALLLVFLKLRFTPFESHKLSLFEIVTRNPIHLAPAFFNP